MATKKASDGISKNPAHATKAVARYVDWEVLKREFMLQADYRSPSVWLYDIKGWPKNKITQGHTKEKISGWGTLRARIQHKITEAAIEEALEQERLRVPTLRHAKALLIAHIVQEVRQWSKLNVYDKRLCYEILKVELAEPTNVKDMKPAGSRDPVEALLEEFGLMKEGEIIIDDKPDDKPIDGRSDSVEAAKPDGKASLEISQD